MSKQLTVVASILLAAGVARGQTVALKPLSSGAMQKRGGTYMPQRAKLSAEKPATITKLPDGISSPMYGVLPIGPAAEKGGAVFHVVIDEPEGKDAALYVDANGNGDLTDDPAAEWKPNPYKRGDTELTRRSGGATVQITYGTAMLPAHLGMYRFDKNDPSPGRVAMKDDLFYYADFGYEGEVALGGKTYKALLNDDQATGDFRGKEPQAEKGKSGVRLLLDVNGNGKFDRQGEDFDVRKPFNIAGTTYEIADMLASGAEFKIVKSSKQVAQVPTPPDHAVGQKITAFTDTTTDGKVVKFPQSYKGKIVMIDFWATWCGPCMAEVPNLVKVYDEFHSKGFDVLGISLDKENSADKVKSVTADHQMTWPQVYDGKYWNARIAELYAIKSIPAAYLVDGDTGEVIADAGLRGATLKAAIQKALEKKQASQKN